MANQNVWIKTIMVDDGEGGIGPDFRGQPNNGWSQIAADDETWLGLVCAPDATIQAYLDEGVVGVYLNNGDEDIIAAVIAEAVALGKGEDEVRDANVDCPEE